MKKTINFDRRKEKKRITKERKMGLPPGALVYVGDREETKDVKIEVYSYDEEQCEARVFTSAQEAIASISPLKNTWINVVGLTNVGEIEAFGKYAQIHNLFIEDILDTQHRPKIEAFDNSILIIIKMLHFREDQVMIEHLALALGSHFLISFQEVDGDVFGGIRKRLRYEKSLLRRKKIDFLFFSLMDAVVDNYFIVLENLSDKIESFEDRIIASPYEAMITEIQDMKREAMATRRCVYPLREVVGKLDKTKYTVIQEDTHKYFGDLSEHAIHVVENIDSYRDMLLGLMDMYMSSMGNRMNNIMKILTIMSTIFIPITFIVGVYGMNFENMPFLKNPWGYYITWAVMIAIAALMLFYYRRKKWL